MTQHPKVRSWYYVSNLDVWDLYFQLRKEVEVMRTSVTWVDEENLLQRAEIFLMLRIFFSMCIASDYWDHILRMIPGESMDGLWKEDHPGCQYDVEEWAANMRIANPRFHFNPHETFVSSCKPSATLSRYRFHVIIDNIHWFICATFGQPRATLRKSRF